MYDRTGYFWNQLYKQSLSRTWLFWKVSEHLPIGSYFFLFFKRRVGWEEAWIFIHVLIMNANRLIGVWQDRLYLKSALQTDNYPCSNLTSLESLRATTNRVIYFFYLTFIKGEWVGGDMTLYIENNINIYVEQTTFHLWQQLIDIFSDFWHFMHLCWQFDFG